MQESTSQTESPPRVAALIVNWNGGELLMTCLRSLTASEDPFDMVIIVDNGSTDGSLEAARELDPGVRVIRNEDNLGFAVACNQGMKAAMESGADFVFLLNNDATIQPETLGFLLRAARRHLDAGLLTGKVLFSDGRRIWSAGVDLGFFPNLQRLRGFRQDDHGQFDAEERVEAVTGCGLLIRRELLEKVGLFDPDYFVYVEDIDLSTRATRAGFSIRYVPDAIVLHDASATTGGGYAPWRKYMVAYNLVVYLKKHGTPVLWAAFLLLEVLAWPAVFLVGLVRGRGRAVLAKGRGTLSALLGRPQRRPTAVDVR